ncbi:hypothetical protein DFP75_106176 [Marinomonas alcarazii]|uniref:Uncharacterized protein n=1 Tax=Marinomonas alcarazii TaxID=491949 RepID=A0A318V2Z8_9GAMM|nr:hypothetical protein DFP75_106176 [Marinomonas alcarazii]
MTNFKINNANFCIRHSREGGNRALMAIENNLIYTTPLDSRLRGNDKDIF